MGFTVIVVRLEPDLGIYLPGQVIQGIVEATVDGPTKCRVVSIKCAGKARVHWTETQGKNTCHYDNKEKYFKYCHNVWTSEDAVIEAGQYSWPFQFTLPMSIPSSFEGRFGWVRYYMKAKADIPMGMDKKCSISFFVNDPFDLNAHEAAKSPLIVRKTDTSGIGMFKRGPVTMNFNCEHSGAVIGEGFKIRGEITNQGSKDIKATKVCLKQNVKYIARTKKRKCSDTVSKIKRGPLEGASSDYFEDVKLPVEAVVPNLTNCHIIDLVYVLEFKVTFGKLSSMKESALFYIGTVPFMIEGATSMIPTVPMPYQVPDNPPPPAYSLIDPATSMYLSQNVPPAYTKDEYSIPGDEYSKDRLPVDKMSVTSNPSAPDLGGAASVSAPPCELSSAHASSHEKRAHPYPVTQTGAGISPEFSQMSPSGITQMPVSGMTPMGFSGMEPMGFSGMLNPSNPYPITGPPSFEECFFCRINRSRLDKKAAPPRYISYAGRMTT